MNPASRRGTRRPASVSPRPRTRTRIRGRSGGAPTSSIHRRRLGRLVTRVWPELVEGLQADFEEAADHLTARQEFGQIRLGPVRLLGSNRLVPGCFGWIREVRASGDAPPSAATGVDLLLGWVYFVVHPRLPGVIAGESPSSPLAGMPWESFAYAVDFRSDPRVFLAVSSETQVAAPILRRFAESLRAELESGAD
jgi:hypothetical protein